LRFLGELLTEQPPTVTVKLRRGAWEVEITCSEDKLQQAVESVLAGMATRQNVDMPEIFEERKSGTCRGLLQTMWRDGWFSTARGLSNVHDEMGRRGYHYDRTAVAHALVDLVREGYLTREGDMRSYTYVQKVPPSQPSVSG
jgi:hypothetical protein